MIQPGNEAELSFMEMILIMRHGSKEEEAADEFIFFFLFPPHKLV